jgi:hypothetical protein
MKIKKIVDICRQSGRVLLCEGKECQWLGDGAAAYPLYGLPRFDENTLYETYDITDKQAEKIFFTHADGLPSGIEFSDAANSEMLIEGSIFTFFYGGKKVRGYPTSQGIAFLDMKYLAPFADVDSSDIKLYERYNANKRLYFAIKIGLCLAGVIMPIDIVDEGLMRQLEKLYALCKIEYFNK